VKHSHPMYAILLLLVMLSGAAGLLYEVIWTRVLVHTLGSTAQAVASVLAAFLGGLAVGAAILGRRADRSRNPLLFYAALETVVGLYALAFPALEQLFFGIVVRAGVEVGLGRFAGTLLLLSPACIAMGGTIPVLCRFAVRSDHNLGARVGSLYAWNTLGAVCGCLLAGFVTIRVFGIEASLRIGAATNLLVALAAVLLARRAGSVHPAPAADGAPPTGRRSPLSGVQAIVLGAFAVSGFTALGYEVLWTRVLVFYVKSITYGFSFMLAVFLLGLVLGSLLAITFVDRKGWALPAFALAELAAGAAAFAAIQLLLSHAATLRALFPSSPDDPTTIYLALALLVVVTILPAGVCFGATFPLAVRVFTGRAASAPGRVGLATAANTGGAILGAFATGFVILPALGVVGALKLLFVANAAAATVLALRGFRTGGKALFGATALLLCVFVLSRGDFFVERMRDIRPGRMIFVDEGEDVIVTVYEEKLPDETLRTIYVNGSSYTGSRFFARRYMKTMGHLPLLLCDRRENALVICLGTGMTLSAVARHEELANVTCAELSRGVVEALPLFADVNDRLAENPRVRIEVADGRHFVLMNDTIWDVITLEPPPPLNAGVVDLYSREFYEICKEKLSPGGALCQWFPLHSQTVEEYAMGLRTFLAVFPNATLWLPVGRNSLAVGFREGGEPWTFERLQERFSAAGVVDALAEIGFPTPESLLATLVLDPQGIADLAGDAPLVTDDRPRLEFHDLAAAARRFPAGELLRSIMVRRIDPAAWLEERGGAEGIDAATYATSAHALELFFRGAYLFEAQDTRGATAAWHEAQILEPDNAYYRSILRPRSR
jgi:spermidine synthase